MIMRGPPAHLKEKLALLLRDLAFRQQLAQQCRGFVKLFGAANEACNLCECLCHRVWGACAAVCQGSEGCQQLQDMRGSWAGGKGLRCW